MGPIRHPVPFEGLLGKHERHGRVFLAGQGIELAAYLLYKGKPRSAQWNLLVSEPLLWWFPS